ncbi:MAG: MAPEG family protein [Mesorhizobium sp.]
MNQTAIFWPMIAQVALVYGVYGLISIRRRAAVRSGEAKASQFRENTVEPASSLYVKNNLTNQFELPVLFFAACLAVHGLGATTGFTLALAWLFVASRYVHAFVHVTTNRIRFRQPAFTLGYLLLGVLWATIAWRLIAG